MRRTCILVATVIFACSALLAESDWPQFRGPNAAAVADDPRLPDVWSKDRNVVWTVEIPGRGWSSPIVWGDRVFLTTVVSEGKEEDAKKGLYFGGERKEPPRDRHQWVVLCLDLPTGKILWRQVVHQGFPESRKHIKNTFASETPVTDGKQVYAYFGNVGVFCLDYAGKLVWKKPFPSVPTQFGWGTAASPALFGGRLFIVNDNEEKSFLTALDAATGKELWRVDREEKSNWATPFVWQNGLRTELVTPGKRKVRSYDLEGRPLWEFSGMSTIVIPTPQAGHGLLYISSGYVMDQLRPLYAVRPGGQGDISLKEGESSNQAIAWCQRQAGPYNPSPLLYGDYLYVLYDRGFLACYDARTGKEVYGRQRLDPSAAAFTSSPWGANGKVFCLSEDGDCFVVQAGPEFKLLGKNSLDEMCMATPALADGKLLIRTLTRLYCLGKGAAASP